MTEPSLARLLKRLRAATGRDKALDRAIARGLEAGGHRTPAPDYTASVDACLALLHRVLPGWHWHVGYGPRGILPYAVVDKGERRHEATAPTVPLALLTALVEARAALDPEGEGRDQWQTREEAP